MLRLRNFLKRLGAGAKNASQHFLVLLFAAIALLLLCFGAYTNSLHAADDPSRFFAGQSQVDADRKSAGCVSCHTATDEPTMHPSKAVHLGCTDCHGGDSTAAIAPGLAPNSTDYAATKAKAHVQPRNPFFKNRTTVPERAYTEWLKESAEYIKFLNPGDLRIAPETCGRTGCHPSETRAVSTNMMTHAGFLWGAALYNNGGFPYKNTRFGESYDRHGTPQTIKTFPPPTPEETRDKGVLPELTPLFRWEQSQPGNILRVFERGGEKKSEIGNPTRDQLPGKPNDKLSDRGLGTELRTDPVFLGLQKTRLLDPILYFPGTFVYILTDKALVVVDLDNPLAPKITATIGAPF